MSLAFHPPTGKEGRLQQKGFEREHHDDDDQLNLALVLISVFACLVCTWVYHAASGIFRVCRSVFSTAPEVQAQPRAFTAQDCPVCLEQPVNPVQLLPCRHELCAECVAQCIRSRNGRRIRCPFDRQIVDTVAIPTTSAISPAPHTLAVSSRRPHVPNTDRRRHHHRRLSAGHVASESTGRVVAPAAATAVKPDSEPSPDSRVGTGSGRFVRQALESVFASPEPQPQSLPQPQRPAPVATPPTAAIASPVASPVAAASLQSVPPVGATITPSSPRPEPVESSPDDTSAPAAVTLENAAAGFEHEIELASPGLHLTRFFSETSPAAVASPNAAAIATSARHSHMENRSGAVTASTFAEGRSLSAAASSLDVSFPSPPPAHTADDAAPTVPAPAVSPPRATPPPASAAAPAYRNEGPGLEGLLRSAPEPTTLPSVPQQIQPTPPGQNGTTSTTTATSVVRGALGAVFSPPMSPLASAASSVSSLSSISSRFSARSGLSARSGGAAVGRVVSSPPTTGRISKETEFLLRQYNGRWTVVMDFLAGMMLDSGLSLWLLGSGIMLRMPVVVAIGTLLFVAWQLRYR